jgi:hypothetical protein
LEELGVVLMYSAVPFGSVLQAKVNNDPESYLHLSKEKKLYMVAEIIKVLTVGYLGFVNQD